MRALPPCCRRRRCPSPSSRADGRALPPPRAGCVLAEALAVHEEVLPVHVDLDVVDALRAELVDHVQRHADVAHEDLHRRLRVLVLEEEHDSTLPAPLGRLADSVDEPLPTLRIRRLERVVVALDPGPDDEVGTELAGEVDRVQRLLHGFAARRRVRRDQTAFSEPLVEMEPRCEAVDVVPVERRLSPRRGSPRTALAGSGTRSRPSGLRDPRQPAAHVRWSSGSRARACSRPERTS